MIALSIVSAFRIASVRAEEKEAVAETETGTETGREPETTEEMETETEPGLEEENGQEEEVEVGTDAPEQLTAPEEREEPMLETGESKDAIYGKAFRRIPISQFSLVKRESQETSAAENAALQIPGEHLTVNISVYINGELFDGGSVSAMEEDDFCIHTWKPNTDQIGEGVHWQEGSWFELQLFQIPGLDLKPLTESGFVINGNQKWKLENGSITAADRLFTGLSLTAIFSFLI